MIRIGLIGTGNMANIIARRIPKNTKIACVYDVDASRAENFAKKNSCEFLRPEDFKNLNLVIEAASQQAVKQHAKQILSNGMNLMIMSIGALADENLLHEIKTEAEKNNVKIITPSGAIAGVDALKAAAQAGIDNVTLTTTKPPKGLTGVKYLEDKGIDALKLSEKTVVYEGLAGEAVRLFPKNVNVAATLSLAGIGFQKTKVRIIADPEAKRNTHELYAKGEFGELRARVDNLPSPDNPKTSYLAALSAISRIKQFAGSLEIA